MSKLSINAVVLLIFMLFPILAHAQTEGTETDSLIAGTIRNIGGADYEQDLKTLAQHPARSTELLIKSLRPVRRGKYRKHPDVIWYIRALRFLTGLDFKARTNGRLNEDEKNFLGSDEQRQVKFFGTWMSRDIAFVAPKDAQVKIIKQWRDWFTAKGKTHTYATATPLDDWYF